MKNKQQVFGMAAALLANLIFGFSFIFSKLALKSADPLIILSIRFTVAFLVLSLLIIFRIIKVNYKKKPIKKLLFMSIAQPLFYFVFELYGIKMVSSALSGIIISLVPVGVLIFSAVFLGEKPTKKQHVCTALSLIGVCVISIIMNDGVKNRFLGIILLIFAVASAVVFNILSRDISKDFSPFERTYFMFLIAFIGFNALAVSVLNKNYWGELTRAFSSTDFIIAVIYLAILSSICAFLLYNYSTTHITAIQSSSFSNIITVVSVFAGAVFLHEMSIIEILICVPIILGVYGVNSR